jgi:RNA polymerase sigma-70 factor (ECF subfamily)
MKSRGETRLDVTLVKRCQAGDESAAAQIFENYKNLVYQTAFLILDSRDDAEDVLQEVFIQAYRSLGKYDQAKGALSTWLHRITVNRCLNWRRRWKFFGVSLDETSENALQAPVISADQRAEIEALRQSVRKLSLKLRTVLILRYYWDLSYAELSEILDLPLGTVKSRLNQALHILQMNLKDEYAPCTLPSSEVSK